MKPHAMIVMDTLPVMVNGYGGKIISTKVHSLFIMTVAFGFQQDWKQETYKKDGLNYKPGSNTRYDDNARRFVPTSR